MKNNIETHFQSVIEKRKQGIALFDNAATAQLPDSVIQAISDFYYKNNYPATGASYKQVEDSTRLLEKARVKTLNFFGAGKGYSVVFCKNATEAFSKVVEHLLYRLDWGSGKILITNLEHNSVYKPLKKLSADLGIEIELFDLLKKDRAELPSLESYKFAALTMASNVIGKVWGNSFSDLTELVQILKSQGAIVALDACQAAAHQKINLDEINADILFFSGHKIGGPHGIGGLIVKNELLTLVAKHAALEPTQGSSDFKALELGSCNLAQIIGLCAAFDFYKAHVNFELQENELMRLAQKIISFLKTQPGIRILGSEKNQNGSYIISFIPVDIPLHDFSWVLAENGALVRSGKMCADLACQSLGVEGCVRISLFLYNNDQDCEVFFKAFEKTINFFKERL